MSVGSYRFPLASLLLALLTCVGCERAEYAPPYATALGVLMYDPDGLPPCSRLSALASYQGSCDDGEACAYAPELDGGVCAPGCDVDADCAEGTYCRDTDDGQGWARSWCAPVVRVSL